MHRTPRGRTGALLVLAALAVSGCRGGPQTARCPGEFDPSKMTRAQLVRHGIGDIPEGLSTSFDSVRWTVEHRSGWIKRNYPLVESVVVGPGWGVTYTNDRYGDTTYHHAPDFMVVTVVKKRAACPDPGRGQLMLISRNYDRVPVRFEYKLKR